MSNTTHTVSQTIYPVEWTSSSAAPNYVLYATSLITTVFAFSSSVSVTDIQGNDLGTLTLPNTTGFTSVYLGTLTIPAPTTANPVFPITLSSAITCNTTFEHVAGNQHAGGSKLHGGSLVPICYETSTFCNDSGSDNDWNDCVLTFQLFNSSTD